MKITIELLGITFRRVKAFAAARGIATTRFFTDAIERQLRRRAVAARGWRRSARRYLRHL